MFKENAERVQVVQSPGSSLGSVQAVDETEEDRSLSELVIDGAICISCSRRKKRYGLSVLNYVVTSNHVHLLLKDIGPNVTV